MNVFHFFRTYFQHEYGERISSIGPNESNPITYDRDGRLVSKPMYSFVFYEGSNLLKSMKVSETEEEHFEYSGNTLVHRLTNGQTFKYIYDTKEGHITQVVSADVEARLFYDLNGHLFALKINDSKTLFVASDENGSILDVFLNNGTSLCQIQRTFWGLIVKPCEAAEENEVFSRIGFHGQFETNGIVIFNNDFTWRAFDTALYQWLTPDVEGMILRPEEWTNVHDIHAYRFHDKGIKMSYMDTYHDWLQYYNIKSPRGN